MASGISSWDKRELMKILKLDRAIELAEKIKSQGHTVVVCGGCFDILHKGHIQFLKLAKKEGDFLLVLLESDENVRIAKGDSRPVNTQKARASLLTTIPSVDYVVLLPKLTQNLDYDGIIQSLKPDVLATTVGEKGNYHLKRQARLINANVVLVTERIKEYSSTKFVNLIETYGL